MFMGTCHGFEVFLWQEDKKSSFRRPGSGHTAIIHHRCLDALRIKKPACETERKQRIWKHARSRHAAAPGSPGTPQEQVCASAHPAEETPVTSSSPGAKSLLRGSCPDRREDGWSVPLSPRSPAGRPCPGASWGGLGRAGAARVPRRPRGPRRAPGALPAHPPPPQPAPAPHSPSRYRPPPEGVRGGSPKGWRRWSARKSPWRRVRAAGAAGSPWRRVRELPPRGLPPLRVSRCRRRLPGAVTISPPPGDFLYGEWFRRKEGGRRRCALRLPRRAADRRARPVPPSGSPPPVPHPRGVCKRPECPVGLGVPLSPRGAVRDSTRCLVVFYNCLLQPTCGSFNHSQKFNLQWNFSDGKDL